MPHGSKVDPRLTKAVLEKLYGKYPNWCIAEVLGLKTQTIGVHAYKLGLCREKKRLIMVKDKTLRKLLVEVVRTKVEEIKRELYKQHES